MHTAVPALEVYDDGTGPALYAGGFFTTAGDIAASSIARWDGAAWSPLGSGVNGAVAALGVYDDGTGPALYAGGNFTTAGGVPAGDIAKWDGAVWSALGSGMNTYSTVQALAAYDDGLGPALYAGGYFLTAGGVPASNIAKWDGAAWSALGSGVNSTVYSLAAYDDGTGPALYAGGSFTTAGGAQANYIAKWDGTAWSALGSGGMNNHVLALRVHDDGMGPALYVGGPFTRAGGVPASYIAKWDGAAWSALGSGMNFLVYAMGSYDDGTAPALYAGGDFTTAGGRVSSTIAAWRCERP
jgi:hypothetical protein